MSIARQIETLRRSHSRAKRSDRAFMEGSPLERAREAVQAQLERDFGYRLLMLRSVPTFASLSDEILLEAVHLLEELMFERGDIIIREGHVGDAFYILSEGEVEITKRKETKTQSELPIAVLGPDSYFGEKSLLTEEYRSATVTVSSDRAKCLRMGKDIFERLIHQSSAYSELHGLVIEKVPLFRDLSPADKEKLISMLQPQFHLQGEYICKQGTTGDRFYIITDGICSVTVFDPKKNIELAVSKLFPGDFFGERALLDENSIRTASVIADENVNCMFLSKQNFNEFFPKFRDTLKSHENALKIKSLEHRDRSMCRRITAYDENNVLSMIHLQNIVLKMFKFMAVALWRSLYGVYYRKLLLQPDAVRNCGKEASRVMQYATSRNEASNLLAEAFFRLYTKPSESRGTKDHELLFGLLKLQHYFSSKYLNDWDDVALIELSKRMQFNRVSEFKKIMESESIGTNMFVIIKGCVRLFSTRRNIVNNKIELDFEADLRYIL